MPMDAIQGYLAAQQNARAQQRGELQQAQVGVGLLQAIQKQQQEKEFRGALASAKTPEKQLAIASKYMGPDALGKMIQSSQDRKVTSDQTKQIALMRLSQQAQKDLTDLQFKARAAQSKEERDHWMQQVEVAKLGFQKQAGEIAAGRYTYETGNAAEPFRGVIPQPAGAPPAPQPMTPTEGTGAAGIQPASAGGSMSGSPGILSLANRVTDPVERAGVLSQILAQQQGAAPAPAPSPAPAAQPGGLASLLPSGPTGKMDMRDILAQRGAPAAAPVAAPVATGAVIAPPAATAPVAQALPPMPPEIASAPARVQNQWRLQQTRPAITGAALSVIPPEHSTLHGKDYLATLPPGIQNTVKSIVEGKVPLTSFSIRNNQRDAMIQRATQYDPTFEAGKAPARMAVQKDFTSGVAARNVTAINTAIRHMGTLDELGQALDSKDVQVANRVINTIRTQFGDPRVNNFDTAKGAVGNELMRVFRQVNASDQETKDWEAKFSSAQSPAQMRGAIKTGVALLQGRIEALDEQWKRGMDTDKGYPQLLTPITKDILGRLGGNPKRRAVDAIPASAILNQADEILNRK